MTLPTTPEGPDADSGAAEPSSGRSDSLAGTTALPSQSGGSGGSLARKPGHARRLSGLLDALRRVAEADAELHRHAVAHSPTSATLYAIRALQLGWVSDGCSASVPLGSEPELPGPRPADRAAEPRARLARMPVKAQWLASLLMLDGNWDAEAERMLTNRRGVQRPVTLGMLERLAIDASEHERVVAWSTQLIAGDRLLATAAMQRVGWDLACELIIAWEAAQ